MRMTMAQSRQKASIYIAAWLALMMIYAAALYTNNAPIDDAVRASIANLLPDALLGLIVLRLPSFVRWSDDHRRFFAAHLGFLIARSDPDVPPTTGEGRHERRPSRRLGSSALRSSLRPACPSRPARS